jgi:hypothetical protein
MVRFQLRTYLILWNLPAEILTVPYLYFSEFKIVQNFPLQKINYIRA